MPILYLSYDENRSGGEICAGQENASYPDHEPCYIELIINGLYRIPPKNNGYINQFEVSQELFEKDILFVAYIRHSDGDTFGTTSGYTEFVGVESTEILARQLIESAKEADYKPWDGYFASLESEEVLEMRLESLDVYKTYQVIES
jgi:hypothetical protein